MTPFSFGIILCFVFALILWIGKKLLNEDENKKGPP